ncbi:hypothetical protein C6Y13_06825 [Lactiplantibacillus pentosus]|nr:hypothetical protein C6Y13_06825 [Lactiplantibacillus pentosus]
MITFFQWLVLLASGYQVSEALFDNNHSGVTSIAVQPVQNNIVDSVFNLIKTLQNRLSLFGRLQI